MNPFSRVTDAERGRRATFHTSIMACALRVLLVVQLTPRVAAVAEGRRVVTVSTTLAAGPLVATKKHAQRSPAASSAAAAAADLAATFAHETAPHPLGCRGSENDATGRTLAAGPLSPSPADSAHRQLLRGSSVAPYADTATASTAGAGVRVTRSGPVRTTSSYRADGEPVALTQVGGRSRSRIIVSTSGHGLSGATASPAVMAGWVAMALGMVLVVFGCGIFVVY